MNFSVLMSVYHKENPTYLKEALESIVNQTLLPNEVIIVEDGPLTDELYAVLGAFKKEHAMIKTYSLPTNQGLGKALNYGLKFCTNEWVARCDSDDINVLERFQEQIAYLKIHPDIDVLGSNIIEFGNDLSDIKSTKIMPSRHQEILQMMKRRNPMCHVTVVFKKSKVLLSGGYQHLPYVEDYYLWARMASQQCILENINKALVYARVGNGMVVRRGNKEQISSWKVLNQFMLEQHLISKKDKWLNMLLIRIFVAIPPILKSLIYRYVLRR